MSTERGAVPPEIGQALKDARRRLGMEITEAEERTKIRTKYLRALEAEDWEVLPAPAYVRGFLRTYGALLGLDGEMLADEFRRRHEAPAAAASPASEPILQGRRSPGSRPVSRGPLIAALALAIVVLFVILGTLGGDDPADEPAGEPTGAGGADGKQGNQGKRDNRSASEPDSREPIDFQLEPLGSVQVCLASSGEALIDAQILAEGTIEQFEGQKRYRVDLENGAVRVEVGGESERLVADGNSSWEVDSNGIRSIEYAGPDCP